MQQTISQRQAAIAAILGQSSYEEINWRALLRQGVFARLHIRRCRFSARLELADLGIRADARAQEALAKVVVLGKKRLLPESLMTVLSRTESAARRSLQECAFRTELGAFVPVSAYERWKQDMETHRAAYFRTRDTILADYDIIVAQILTEYRALAADTYRRISGQAAPDTLDLSCDDFIARYCERIQASIPTRERIQQSFAFEAILSDGLRQVAEPPDDAPIGTLPTPGLRREQQQAAMERDLRVQAEGTRKAQMDDFLGAIVVQMRAAIYEAVTDVLATIQKREEQDLGPRSIVQLKNLIEQISLLNFTNDEEVRRILTQVQTMLELSPERRRRSAADIQTKLRDIATVVRATLIDLEEELRPVRLVGIPDNPGSESVRAARMQLGLDLSTPDFALRYERGTRLLGSLQPLWRPSEERAVRIA
jgi:hypothetical protein